MYEIQPYSFQRAKEIGVEIRPSSKGFYKLDVFRQGKYLASIGDSRYGDYPTFLATRGKEYADIRRDLYRKRHTSQGLRELLSLFLLW